MRALGRALAIAAVVLASCQTPAPTGVASPTPTPPATTAAPTPTFTPEPTPSPTPPPTPPPTQPRTERPHPTTRTAGLPMLAYYAEVRLLFPILPAGAQIDFDDPAGSDNNATFRGLNAQGQPIFSVREDFVLDKGTAAHEIGHAFDAVIAQKLATPTLARERYWTFRGFPGTWDQAMIQSRAQTSYSAQWIWSPTESWGEAFRAAVMLERKERTMDYGKTIDPQACRDFFLSLMALATPSAAR